MLMFPEGFHVSDSLIIFQSDSVTVYRRDQGDGCSASTPQN